MEAFTDLRRQALLKRDKALAIINKEYQDTLQRIAALEQDITGRVHTMHRKMADIINDILPRDKPFTTLDVFLALKAADDSRDWVRRSIDCHISRMRDIGFVVRLRRHHGKDLAVYALATAKLPEFPFGDMTLVEAIQAVLKDGPLRTSELSVKLLEGGFYTMRKPNDFRAGVAVALKKNPGLFEKGEGGKWVVAG